METSEQLSLFDFVKPTIVELDEMPDDVTVKKMLKLGMLGIFANPYEKAADRIKAGSELSKMVGGYEPEKTSVEIAASSHKTITIVKAEDMVFDD